MAFQAARTALLRRSSSQSSLLASSSSSSSSSTKQSPPHLGGLREIAASTSSASSQWSKLKQGSSIIGLSSSIFEATKQQGHHYYSTSSAAAVSPTPTPGPSDFIPGHADAAGTANFARKIGARAAPGHFRSLRLGGTVGDLVLSSIGMGTYGGPETDICDREYVESLTRGMSLGLNLIDCASNYRTMHSELALGKCISLAIKQGVISRNEVIVCSKAGFLSFDYREDIDPYTYIDNKYINTNLFTREEFVGGCHCLSPAFLKNQVEVSRRNLGLETIDIYFVHNPETQLNMVSRSTVLGRMKGAFQAMEELCSEGKITAYGVATWNAFRVNSSGKQHLPLEELMSYAKEIAGEGHHFKVVQAPYNGKLQEAANQPTQAIRGKRMPLFHAAHHLGLSVIASSSLDNGYLTRSLNPDIRAKFPELGENRTNAQCAIQFARTTPGVLATLVGMRTMSHLEENTTLIGIPANSRSG